MELAATVKSITELTQAAKFLEADDISFLHSIPAVSANLHTASMELIALFNSIYSSVSGNDELTYESIGDFVENFQPIQDTIDGLLEKVDVCLELANPRRAPPQPSIGKGEDSEISERSIKRVRPQDKFKTKPDNSSSAFVPIITSKPNALRPLDIQLAKLPSVDGNDGGHASYAHPYAYEIANISYPASMFQLNAHNDCPPEANVDDIVWVSNLEDLTALCADLEQSLVLAVDLEHHDFRTFMGFTCLIQISTELTDYVIDALKLRHDLHHLNRSFTNPKIVKVFHGATMDMQWLQRDFGVYVVNLFDTFHASNLLELPRHSYEFLLDHYCQVQTDKKYQLADWRTRPIPKEMLLYAQMDTHYLIYIYECMRTELIERSNPTTLNLLHATLDRSAETSALRFEKDVYDKRDGQGQSGWARTFQKCRDPMSSENFAVYRELHEWRDQTARKEDESLRFVLPNHMLFTLARIMPINAQDLIGCCTPTPSLVRLYANDLADIISRLLISMRIKPDELEVAATQLEQSKASSHTRFESSVESPHILSPKFNIIPRESSKLRGSVQSLAKSSLFGSIAVSNTSVEKLNKKRAEGIRASITLDPPVLEDSQLSAIDEKKSVIVEVEEPMQINDPPESEQIEVTNKPMQSIKKQKHKRKASATVVDDSFTPFDYSAAQGATPKSNKKKRKDDQFTLHGNIPDDSFKVFFINGSELKPQSLGRNQAIRAIHFIRAKNKLGECANRRYYRSLVEDNRTSATSQQSTNIDRSDSSE